MIRISSNSVVICMNQVLGFLLKAGIRFHYWGRGTEIWGTREDQRGESKGEARNSFSWAQGTQHEDRLQNSSIFFIKLGESEAEDYMIVSAFPNDHYGKAPWWSNGAFGATRLLCVRIVVAGLKDGRLVVSFLHYFSLRITRVPRDVLILLIYKDKDGIKAHALRYSEMDVIAPRLLRLQQYMVYRPGVIGKAAFTKSGFQFDEVCNVLVALLYSLGLSKQF
ncbi:hypothetical protein VNO77_34168 [Canavalia gladiata]|uniref:Uncharacterized protein n=1 Tax=Canavalia gladiata TaxID=3824 RepID=A0AAN9PYB6_CANGL